MAVVVGTVLPLLVIDPTATRSFLTLVAVFSGDLACSGYGSLRRAGPASRPGSVDWAGVVLVAGACLPLGGWGVLRVVGGDPFGVVMAVFGGIGLAFGAVDARAVRRGRAGAPRVVTYLTQMLAALIATVTAISAVDLTFVPTVVAWLWPTVLGTALIAYHANRNGG